MNRYLLILLLMPMLSIADGLRCPSSNSEFDTYLCNAYQISNLDKKLNAIYISALEEQSKSLEGAYNMHLQAEQRKWIKERDLCLAGKDSHACLVQSYNYRISTLRNMLPSNFKFSKASADSSQFTTQQIEYSVWSSRNEDSSFLWPWENVKRHYFRKKAVLINTSTGESWGLEYTGTKQTADGYSWVKIPFKK